MFAIAWCWSHASHTRVFWRCDHRVTIILVAVFTKSIPIWPLNWQKISKKRPLCIQIILFILKAQKVCQRCLTLPFLPNGPSLRSMYTLRTLLTGLHYPSWHRFCFASFFTHSGKIYLSASVRVSDCRRPSLVSLWFWLDFMAENYHTNCVMTLLNKIYLFTLFEMLRLHVLLRRSARNLRTSSSRTESVSH